MMRHLFGLGSFAALVAAACLAAPASADQGWHLYQWSGSYGGSNFAQAYPGNPGGYPSADYTAPGFYAAPTYAPAIGPAMNYSIGNSTTFLPASNYSYGSSMAILPSSTIPQNGTYLYGAPSNSSRYYANTMDQPARIDVTVPADAQLWFNGAKTRQTGPFRQFTSPPVSANGNFYYDIKAQWMQDGKEITRTRQVAVRPGQTATVTIDATER